MVYFNAICISVLNMFLVPRPLALTLGGTNASTMLGGQFNAPSHIWPATPWTKD